MTEFLTENAGRAYPLDGEWPSGLAERWAGTLVDACVYASLENAGDKRIMLDRVKRNSSESLTFRVRVQSGVGMNVVVPAGLYGFATIYAQSNELKAFLTVDGRKVDELLADSGYSTSWKTVNVPLAMRCTGFGTATVTSITAQGASVCETPMYSASDPHRVEVTVPAGEDAILRSGDGVDIEVTEMVQLGGSVLRISAMAAAEQAESAEKPVDMMIRGDDCFSVEAIPGADNALGESTGEIVIRNACKPCCQCEDYVAAADMLKPAERQVWEVNAVLDEAESAYAAALSAYEAAKAGVAGLVDSADNVHVSATAVCSCGMYSESTAGGTRQRISVTMLVANMTTKQASVTVGNDGTRSGFYVPGYSVNSTMWVRIDSSGRSSGSTRPSVTLAPGGTLSVTSIYVKSGTSNTASKPAGMKAYCSISVNGSSAVREVDVK